MVQEVWLGKVVVIEGLLPTYSFAFSAKANAMLSVII
jgi:hypothetical protein